VPEGSLRAKKMGTRQVKKENQHRRRIDFQKASGFYVTDYRSDTYKDAAKKDIADSGRPKASQPRVKANLRRKSESKPAKSPPKKLNGISARHEIPLPILTGTLAVLNIANAQWKPDPNVTVIGSVSGQFFVSARGAISPHSMDLASGPDMVTCSRRCSRFLCERIKQTLLRELNMPDQWREDICHPQAGTIRG